MATDESTLTSVLFSKLDPIYLIKLVLQEDRSQRQKDLNLNQLVWDITSNKLTIMTDQNISYEKIFPTLLIFLIALTSYGTIRDIFDQDHLTSDSPKV